MKTLLSLIALVVAAGALYLYVPSVREALPLPGQGTPEPEQVFCTQDAMQCPDGSWVGRTGPNCEFVCPAGGTGGEGEGLVAYKSGVRGTVTVGPTCPVEKDPPDPACADKPLSTLVAIFRASDPVHAFVLTRADAQGKFEASLPPGDYTVGAGESELPRCPTTAVTVGPDTYVSVAISCDSGIR